MQEKNGTSTEAKTIRKTTRLLGKEIGAKEIQEHIGGKNENNKK
jgi:hypothetical protein